jgi:N-carbamoylputrescine amidase
MNGKTQAVKVGLVQLSPGDSPVDNFDRALDACRTAAGRGAQIVCLPELFRSRYFCQREDTTNFDLAEPVPGPSTEALAAVAAETGCTIVASLFEARTPGVYHNTVAVLDGDAGFIGKYRKMHIPEDPRYYEKYYFTPGDLGYRVFDTRHGRLGTLICWDQWFPEAARITAMLGAQIIFYPTAIGWHPEEKAELGQTQHDAWETIQRGHAIANGCYVVAVNRCGFEPEPGGDGGIEFWGQSFAAGPDGQIICKAAADQEAILVAELDLAAIARQRHGWPFFRDRRIETYGDLAHRFAD